MQVTKESQIRNLKEEMTHQDELVDKLQVRRRVKEMEIQLFNDVNDRSGRIKSQIQIKYKFKLKSNTDQIQIKYTYKCSQREKRGAGDGRQKIDEDIQVETNFLLQRNQVEPLQKNPG